MGLILSDRRGFMKKCSLTAGVLAAEYGFIREAFAAGLGSGKVTTDSLITLLQELIYARGPVGQEDEVRAICEREVKNVSDESWVDEAGNVIGLIKGGKSKNTPVIRIMAHMDENAMMVKRVNGDGTLRVRNLGGLRPGNIGQGQVEILADSGILPGVLSMGPMHSSRETPGPHATRTDAIGWSHVFVFTRKTAEELDRLGVHAGTRVVIARERRKLFDIEDCVGGFFMDDRACVVIALAAAALLKERKERPANDVYLAMTIEEEIGAIGASYAARTLPGAVTVAVDVGPVASEYKTELTAEPIVAFGDASGVYSMSVSKRLFDLAKELGMKPQTATWESYGSDASISKRYGQSALGALLCIPTENTHGYEIIQRDGMLTCARLLAAYMKTPVVR